MNARYFACTLILLAGALSCVALTWGPSDSVLRHYDEIAAAGTGLLWIADGLAIWALYRSGNFRRSRFGRLFKILIACYFVVAVARIQHWSFAGILVPVPFLGTVVLYTIWFCKKPVKQPADFLKLAWVGVHCVLTWLVLTRNASLPTSFVPLISTVLLFAAYGTTYFARRLELDVPVAASRR